MILKLAAARRSAIKYAERMLVFLGGEKRVNYAELTLVFLDGGGGGGHR